MKTSIKLLDKAFSAYGTKISENIWEDNNGQLIIHDAVLARCGSYNYLESEIFPDGDKTKIIQVYRSPKDVFDPVSIASFENKPFCDEHPHDDVTPENFRDLQVGFLRDVHRGTGEYANCLMGDIIVMDPEVIQEIKNGKRELSLGYNTEIVQKEDGKYYMTKIRGNHLALVDNGRAGVAVIRDSKTTVDDNAQSDVINKKISKGVKNEMAKKIIYKPRNRDSFINKLYDEDVVEIEELEDETDIDESGLPDVEAPAEAVEEAVTKDVRDDDKVLARIESKLDKLLSLLDKTSAVADEEEVAVEELATDEDVTTDMTEEEEPTLYDEDEDVSEEVVETEEEVEEDEVDDCDTVESKVGDKAAKLYQQFTGVKDSAVKGDLSEQVNSAFKNRYSKFGGKN